jgi:hypothetical protein
MGSDFEIEFIDRAGEKVRGPLERWWGQSFETVTPVRSFPCFKGQSNFPGGRWSASSGHVVGHESWLERDNAMLLDFDEQVVAYSSQPFWLYWTQGAETKRRRHAPDFFARLADGGGLVVDVREDHRIKDRDAQAFAATERACRTVGWGFQRVGRPEPVFAANVRWLAGYRRPFCLQPDVAERAVRVFAEPQALFAGADALGGRRVLVLPVLYHLMWHRVLRADLKSRLLDADTVVSAGGA